MMDELFLMVQSANTRFPEGNEPFQMLGRLLEECGEVAAEVNLWEDTGIKRMKHGDPKKEDLAGEIRQAMVALAQLAEYYGVRPELEASVMASLSRSRAEGLLPEASE